MACALAQGSSTLSGAPLSHHVCGTIERGRHRFDASHVARVYSTETGLLATLSDVGRRSMKIGPTVERPPV